MKKIVLFTTLLSSVIFASEPLTLQSAIDKTLQNHPDIKSFSLKVEQSKESYNSSFSDFLPQVNLQANYNPIESLHNGSWNVGASVRQKLWDFSKTSNLIDASKIDEDISKLSLEDMKVLLSFKVKSFYSLMVVKQETIKVREKDLELKESYYAQAKALVEQGLKTNADASRFLSAVYLSKNNLFEARASYEKAKNSLSLYMGEALENDVELDSGIIKTKQDFNKDSLQNILDENYALKIYNQTIDKNTLLYKSAKASHFGSLDAVASYSHIDSVNSYDSKLVGVSLNIPIYSGGKITAEAQKARIGFQIAKEQRASKELALKEEIKSLLIDIDRYGKTIEAKKAELQASQETKQVLDARYKEGLSTYIEILDSASLVLNAQLGVLEAYYLQSTAINKITYLRGKI